MPINNTISLRLIILILLFFIFCASAFAIEDDDKRKPGTTGNPAIPLEQLELMLDPMTRDELFVEADAWLKLLKKASRDVSQAQLSVKKKNQEIEDKKKQEQAKQKEKETIRKETEEKTGIKVQEKSHQVTDEKAKERAQKKIQQAAEEKANILKDIAHLRDIRTEMVDRLNLVLTEINEKIGTDEQGKELQEVKPYRLYINAVSGLKVDITDTETAWVSLTGWLLSEEGGIRWFINISTFIVILLVFWMLSLVIRKAVKKALHLTNNNSQILNNFFITISQRATVIIGLLIGLSAMEINIGPILAVIGAAGFVVAFALQSTLSNFASGIMIMFYRPFDVGDMVDVAGIVGKVNSMTLVSTTLMTPDNKLMVVPNNSIWGDVITNITKSDTRRVDMIFGIGYEDDIDHARQIMLQILADHPLVLKEPDAVVRLHELADSSVNFVCRPWVKTVDYWEAYWDITRLTKERFDAEGISIPYPQQDVHIHQKISANHEPDHQETKASKQTGQIHAENNRHTNNQDIDIDDANP